MYHRTRARKEIIIESLRYLTKQKKVNVHAFVLMDNHFHIIWRIGKGLNRENVQRDFLKYTAQQILKNFRNEQAEILQKIEVNLKDRKYQVWQRNSLSIELRSEIVYKQKLDYIHNNPLKAGLCASEEEYKYSSAGYYIQNKMDWDFLTNAND
ncbi:MAG: transposase [Sphingobacteriales bacterium]|nr:transposase [Sphingobacteriales bacterium]